MCFRFLCVCVQYKCPSGLHLCQLSLSESTAYVPIFLTLPAFFFPKSHSSCMSLSLHAASMLRHMCLTPFLSPSATPQGRLLNAAICLRLPVCTLASLPCSAARESLR